MFEDRNSDSIQDVYPTHTVSYLLGQALCSASYGRWKKPHNDQLGNKMPRGEVSS